MSDVLETIGKLVGCWYLAGAIMTALGVLWAYATGGLAGLTVELITDAVFARFFFPLDVYITWLLSPTSIILQVLLAVILFAWSERGSGPDFGGLF